MIGRQAVDNGTTVSRFGVMNSSFVMLSSEMSLGDRSDDLCLLQRMACLYNRAISSELTMRRKSEILIVI